jgi:deazaflavin-dependent oxidoreductase (nitroreductase family)
LDIYTKEKLKMSAESGATHPNTEPGRDNIVGNAGRGQAARLFRNRSVRRVFLALYRPIINPLVLLLVGSKRASMMAVIQHQGRKSGRAYSTPVSARATPDGFVVPLNFGDTADWFKNVKAAGGCTIEWNGARYPVVEPRIVDWSVAKSAFSPWEQKVMGLVGMANFVELRHAQR